MTLSLRKRPKDRGTPRFSFCEPVQATPFSKEHIREVGEEGLKPGGGIVGEALCGRDVSRGWDLSMPVTPDNVYTLSTPRPGDDRVFLCGRCAEVVGARLSD